MVDRRLSGQNPWDPVAMAWDALTGAAGGKLVDELAGLLRRGVPTRVAAPGASDDLAPRAPASVGDDMAGAACSFSGATLVLMADGTRVPISEVEEGNYVYATDPETGESGPREVIATLPHADQLLTLRTSSGEIVTTEDHKYWNATDNEWQESQELDPGDRLLTADGHQVTVEGLDWSSVRTAAAYDLDIADLHTFYVAAGHENVLVHNCSIRIGADDMDHVLQRHTLAGQQAHPQWAGRSYFYDALDIEDLIRAADSVPPVRSGGNELRIVNAGRNIGWDRATGAQTQMYTVVTRQDGSLVTAYPGLPPRIPLE